jgi:hypothetical protein
MTVDASVLMAPGYRLLITTDTSKRDELRKLPSALPRAVLEDAGMQPMFASAYLAAEAMPSAVDATLLVYGHPVKATQQIYSLTSPLTAKTRGCLCVYLDGHPPGDYLVVVLWSDFFPIDPLGGGCPSCPPGHSAGVLAFDASDQPALDSFGGQPLTSYLLPLGADGNALKAPAAWSELLRGSGPLSALQATSRKQLLIYVTLP